jgi:membrane protease YdiL (CAAX protease family)
MAGTLALGLGAGLAVWAVAVGAFAASGHPQALDDPASLAYGATAAVAYAATAAVLVVFLLRVFGSASAAGLGRLHARDAIAVGGGVALVAALRIATFWYLVLIHRQGHVQNGLGAFHVAGPVAALVTVAVGATLAPFAEELIYRGCVYRTLRAMMPGGRAAFLSALVFAAARFDLVLFPFFTAYGFLLALLYRRTGTLYAPMLVRAIFDGACYALLVWLDTAALTG